MGVFEVLWAGSFLWFSLAPPFPVQPLEAPESANQAFVVMPLEQLELFMILLLLPSGHTHLPQVRTASPRSASGRLGMTVCFPVLVQGTDPLLVLFFPQHTGDCRAGGGNVTHHAPVLEPSITFFKMHTLST